MSKALRRSAVYVADLTSYDRAASRRIAATLTGCNSPRPSASRTQGTAERSDLGDRLSCATVIVLPVPDAVAIANRGSFVCAQFIFFGNPYRQPFMSSLFSRVLSGDSQMHKTAPIRKVAGIRVHLQQRSDIRAGGSSG